MLVQDQNALQELKDRTRARNRTIFHLPLDYLNALAPLRKEAEVLNSLGMPMIEGYMAATDEIFFVKNYEQQVESDLEYRKLENQQRIADADAATERAKLAYKLAAEEYVQNARLYDARVQALIMAAREYAAEVEREQIELERLRSILAVEKQETRLKEINAEIYYEYVKRMEVEVDVARAKLDVAKANTRAVLADIQAQEAELEITEAELQEAMQVAEKATLQADVAAIYAEIITKRLSEIRLDVSRAEIEAGFRYVQSKLNDLLGIWDIRTRTVNLRTQNEQEIYDEVMQLLAVEEAAEDIKKLAQTSDEDFLTFKAGETAEELTKEQQLLDERLTAREDLMEHKNSVTMSLDDLAAWAKALANGAQCSVYQNRRNINFVGQDMKLYVDKG
jgi:hypothetical protein